MAEQETISALEEKLQQKEQLVGALTKRLEQAAEQLDRLKRSGAERRGSTGRTGSSAGALSQQKQLLDNLQQTVEKWDEAQVPSSLGRIENQLTEIRDLITSGVGSGTGLASSSLGSTSASQPSGGSTSPTSDGGGGWEALKANLLAGAGGESKTPADTPPDPEPTETDTDETEQSAAPSDEDVASLFPSDQEEEVPPVDPPKPLDSDEATHEQLLKAVDDRDAYIAYLTRKLRIAESRSQPRGHWRDLESIPEERENRLEKLEEMLNEKLRTAEVELSLERARLAREAARISHADEHLQKQLRQMGIADGQGDHEGGPDDKEKGGRWFRMLGVGRDED